MKPVPKERVDEKLLVEYADGALDPAHRAEVERYLDEHPEARALVDAYRADLDCVRKGLAEPPTSAAPSAVAVQRLARRQRIRRRVNYSVAAACSSCLLALVLWPGALGTPVPESTNSQDAEARLTALNDRIAHLEQQVAELEAALDRREPIEIELSLGDFAQEESAAIVYEAARFYEQDGRNVSAAMSRYRDIVARFPNTQSAARADERIRTLTSAAETRRSDS